MKRRFVLILVFVAVCGLLVACAGKHTEVASGLDKQADITQIDMSLVSEELSSIKFVPDSGPMPDVGVWMEKANQNIPAAQFIVSMMYRDNIGVKHYEDGKISVEKVDQKREMNRWLGRSEEEKFILADLSHHPSLIYNQENFEFGEAEIFAQAVSWLEIAANHGYGHSEFVLGLMYWNGVGVERDKNRGIELIRRAAFHQVSMAQYDIGMMYELGIGLNEDPAKSLQWLHYAAQNGSQDAKFILVMKYRDGIGVNADMQVSDAFRKDSWSHHIWSALLSHFGEFDQVCMVNYDEAEISYAYEDGCGGEDEAPWDDDLSLEENERIRNAFYLDERTRKSLDYAIDYELATKWMRKAVEKSSHFYSGVLRAQTIFSSGCLAGLDFENTFEREQVAEEVLNRVCANETPDCLYYKASLFHNAEDVYECIGEECGFENLSLKEKAFDLYQKAANAGNKSAMWTLGLIYRNFDRPNISEKLHIKEDALKAFEWFEKVSDEDEDKYMLRNTAYEIGVLYRNGETIIDHPDLLKAAQWFQKAIEYGDLSAAKDLAKIYRNENFTARDEVKLTNYMRQYLVSRAKEHYLDVESAEEALILGNNYKKGLHGASLDEKEALKWYKLGVESYNDMCFKNDTCKLESQRYQEGEAEIAKLERMEGLSSMVEKLIQIDEENEIARHVYDELIQKFKKYCSGDENYCFENIKSMYEDAVHRAVKSVIALAFSENDKTLSDEKIKNTLYETIVYQANVYKNFQKYIELSKYCSQLFSPDAISSIIAVERYMYIIWYLEHVSKAASVMYNINKQMNTNNYNDVLIDSQLMGDSREFLELLKKADEYMKNNETAKNSYGYNFNEIIQLVDLSSSME